VADGAGSLTELEELCARRGRQEAEAAQARGEREEGVTVVKSISAGELFC